MEFSIDKQKIIFEIMPKMNLSIPSSVVLYSSQSGLRVNYFHIDFNSFGRRRYDREITAVEIKQFHSICIEFPLKYPQCHLAPRR